MIRVPLTAIRLFLAFLLLAPACPGYAIIIRHDKADSRYRVEEADYPQLFYLLYRFDNKVCMGTLISARWAITAAHCTEQTPILAAMADKTDYEVMIAGQSYRIDKVVLHPLHDTGNQFNDVDLALLRFDREVAGVTPVNLYRGTDEQDRVFALLGWGFTGIGTLGLQTNDGRFRRAENRVFEAGQWLKFRFDDPRKTGNKALQLEGVPGLGDSGGPALLETDDGYVLAGVALGELELDEGGEPAGEQGRYGAVELYERISSHLAWIEQVISRQ